MIVGAILSAVLALSALNVGYGLRYTGGGDRHDIRLRTLKGNLSVLADGMKTVGDLRHRLQSELKLPVDLFQDGKRLDNSLPIDDVCLQKNCRLIEQVAKGDVNMMIPLRGGMRVQVQTMQGQKLEVDVEPNETVLDLKKKLSSKQKLPVDQQRIIFEGKMLQDNKTLADYNIKVGMAP
ncbi:Polyubiqutin 1, putative [Babesia ovata]|uniref:Polyubiqutin 1, putative n=1 Tax=Babesia ovata TaxID=189622 RepID=A0A2H6KD42_9APIC|nr:Polyubiqutin 1, putative [Babesia ovata]GBE60916.1 Polyubiqutin 1, putative [Babesia ovata]